MNKAPLIVALDVANSSEIDAILARVPADLRTFKIGLELFCAEGPRALAPLRRADRSIFLDLKLHDIPRTVARAVRSAAQHQVDLLTLHASGGRAMMEQAARAAQEFGQSRPQLLAVTALTSLDERDFAELGFARSPSDHVLRLAELAMASGLDGLVCSPHEVRRLRQELGPAPLLVTPGIRLPTDPAGDQKRTGTPGQAMRDGATYLVVGRPIVDAPDPATAVRAMLEDIRKCGDGVAG